MNGNMGEMGLHPLGWFSSKRPALTREERASMIFSLQNRHGPLRGIEEISDENLRTLFGDKPETS